MKRALHGQIFNDRLINKVDVNRGITDFSNFSMVTLTSADVLLCSDSELKTRRGRNTYYEINVPLSTLDMLTRYLCEWF